MVTYNCCLRIHKLLTHAFVVDNTQGDDIYMIIRDIQSLRVLTDT